MNYVTKVDKERKIIWVRPITSDFSDIEVGFILNEKGRICQYGHPINHGGGEVKHIKFWVPPLAYKQMWAIFHKLNNPKPVKAPVPQLELFY